MTDSKDSKDPTKSTIYSDGTNVKTTRFTGKNGELVSYISCGDLNDDKDTGVNDKIIADVKREGSYLNEEVKNNWINKAGQDDKGFVDAVLNAPDGRGKSK